jgi:hypothetical protein
MSHSVRCFLLMVAVALQAGVARGAPGDDLAAASIGTWKATSPDGRVQTVVTYEDRGQGFIVATISAPDQSGQLVVTAYYAMRLDGREYPFSGRNQKGIGTIVHRVPDNNTLEYDIKVDGEITTRGARILSKDRRTMTLTARDGSRPPIVLQKQL